MSSFGDRLREEIEYTGMSQKEVAEKSGVKKRALDMYVGCRGSIPSADIAVRLAQVLGVSVEYLVTGEGADSKLSRKDQHILSCLKKLPDYERNALEVYIETVSNHQSRS